MVKGLLQLERVMVYAKAYYFFKVNSKCGNFRFFIVRRQITIASDQEDESIWKILAIENQLPDIGFKT